MDHREERDHSLIGCPLWRHCLAGQFSGNTCPAYDGVTQTDGMLAVKCKSSETGLEVPCPKCTDHRQFHKSRGVLQEWVCRNCGYYMIPNYVDTLYDHDGFTLPVKCGCGHKSAVIPLPTTSISNQDWTCPACGRKDSVFNVLDRNVT